MAFSVKYQMLLLHSHLKKKKHPRMPAFAREWSRLHVHSGAWTSSITWTSCNNMSQISVHWWLSHTSTTTSLENKSMTVRWLHWCLYNQWQIASSCSDLEVEDALDSTAGWSFWLHRDCTGRQPVPKQSESAVALREEVCRELWHINTDRLVEVGAVSRATG